MEMDGVEDVDDMVGDRGLDSDDASVKVWTQPGKVGAVRTSLADHGYVATAELLLYVPNACVDRLEEDAIAVVEEVIADLKSLDDVEDVWSNLPN